MAIAAESIIGVSPFGEPDARLVAALCSAGALGVLDLGSGDRRARRELDLAQRWTTGPFGVRLGPRFAGTPGDLPARVEVVVLGTDRIDVATAGAGGRRVLVEVTSLAEAAAAAAAGAHGILARGFEAGGRVGELSSFVLLQQLLSDLELPVWSWGGIGPHTAAAAVLGGAAGVVLDSQLALLREAAAVPAAAIGLGAMDGTETEVLDGHRILRSRSGAGCPLPVGQDGFLAGEFARRYGDVATVVRAVRDAVAAGSRTDAVEAFGQGSVLAGRMRTRLGVVQGPMTRVSDRPELAVAVADAGGLPFMALALADAAATRTLLESTARELDGRPWGAGILGFAPEETRAAQLDVIREVRPAAVIIAGGRPAQALALEDEGIATFLHVPSPRLLGQFLAAGARRFVFEGAECGGHIGPRSSFCLWQAQIDILLDFREANPGVDLDVLFAGGVHDARSAAMIAAMAAPLTATGVGVGVLMGTGYLFTAEAVRSGAIGRGFQEQVRAARGTSVLETAPGHLTRCVESPFTTEFDAIRARLRAAGGPEREVWHQLEQLNVGRLRIASKGLRRDGDALVAVDETARLAEGLFMAGQVAVLRADVTTVADLHAAVTDGAAAWVAGRAEGPVAEPVEAPEPLDIAIIGLAGVFGGAKDTADFWANVLDGVDSVTEVPAQRWDARVHYSADPADGRLPSKWGGFLPPIAFDALRFGIPPTSLAAIEPVQLIALEVARRALADAGYADSARPARPFDRSRTAVVFGAESGGELSTAATLRATLPGYLADMPAALDAQLPRFTEDTFPGVLANVISGRIANRLDLGGANYTVDAACASSLAALDVACRELATGTADLALCGGADTHNGVYDYHLFASVGALSPTGRSRPFDTAADGIALGEGVGCVVLKRLADAERDGDRVYAVVRGIGSSSDGRSLGLTAPRADGQRRAMTRAYSQAGLSPADVGLVEAHGTGTAVGDRTELATLTEVFGAAGARPGGTVLGSVKSQIGHTKCAAGLAGLIKTALAVHTGVRPPTSQLTSPAAQWVAGTSPFVFNTRALPWAAAPVERVAAVSGFGFGGTNFHAVLTGHPAPAPRHGHDRWPAELFLFGGAACVDWLRGVLDAHPAARLRDLALTAARRFDQAGTRAEIAVVARDVPELSRLLAAAVTGEPTPGPFTGTPCSDPRVAVLFPGQGSQRVGMAAELLVAFPELQELLRAGRHWADALYPGAAFDEATASGQRDALRDTTVAQPALGIADLAAYQFLGAVDLAVDMVAGHSYGELVALAAAGVLSATELLDLSAARAELILAAAGEDPGTMAAVSAPAEEVRDLLDGLAGVVLANHNAPTQVVVSGPTGPMAAAVKRLRAAGLSVRELPVACAFHSPVVAGAGAGFAELVAAVPPRAPEVQVWANRTAAPYGTEPLAVAAELGAQIGAPVRFADQIEAMYAAGARIFVECGPGTVLSGLVAATLDGRPHRTVHFDGAGGGLPGALSGLAELAVGGARLRLERLFHGRDAVELSATSPAVIPQWTVDGQLVRDASGRPLPGCVTAARQVTVAAPGPSVDPDALVSDYFRTTREFVAAQRDVLLAYFGTEPAGPRPPAESRLPEPVPAPARPVTESVSTLRVVVDLIGERTGYPVDMIEPDLDLEADLSIDSIKRTELVGELATRFAHGGLGDHAVDALTQLRTAGAIAAWLDEKLGRPGEPSTARPVVQAPTDVGAAAMPQAQAAAAAAPTPGSQAPEGRSVPEPPDASRPRHAAPAQAPGEGPRAPRPVGVAPARLLRVPEPAPADRRPDHVVTGRVYAICGARTPVGVALAALLTGLGAAVVGPDDLGAADAFIHLDALAPATDGDGPLLPDQFPQLRSAALAVRRFLAVTPCPAGAARPEGEDRAAGMSGFVRSVAHERPDATVRLLEVDPARPAADNARLVLDELCTNGGPPVVRCGPADDPQRSTLVPRPAPLGALATTGGGPDGQGAAEAAALGLGREAVLLLIGGARGITARFAATVAGASGCRIVLAGRTAPADTPEPDELAQAADLPAVRAALGRLRRREPAELDRDARLVLARREVAATLAELRALGSQAHYMTVDARDSEAVRGLVKWTHTEFGRLDGVVFAAGVIEDRLLADKTVDSFHRVFTTKVDGARHLLDALGDLPAGPGFVVLFGSIAAVLGNRGQTDYAAANDALESLGRGWAARTGHRALTVHWGPWAPDPEHGGMVTAQLAADYRRRSIGLIEPHEGASALLRELAWGDPTLSAVVYTASGC
ncbi:polyketide synthase [Longispora fulva]|uniref:Acyl transferase domain-containing protein/NAD(P)H-dependent flavin oxidoreductase YrpB (Nitropropane dioxygenase family)/acyl carrier protein n=1 Tax=Longispora fulva TaxID=619741 RepID=A0A8J7KWC3_9ACTN|nr:type I polyketide synthase [Longispora fulva]MBG6136382.1 acyl transferase domain-containing protein/NAD(P)H-dependent flavin oxidoreductase YrpB (nitropropane dioxygenase family)/acyl carrier protein [Longispora fulva]GIG63445.1 polyketide synthase [Longispora fulva]